MRLFCLVGAHRRSRKKVRHDGERFVSVCRGCGAAMAKMLDDRWQVVPAPDSETA